jgi:hypothetical protein
MAATDCTTGVCVGEPNSLAAEWFQLFVAKDPNFDISNLTHAEFDRLAYAGMQEYTSTLDTSDADLSEFHNVGGKIISFHGLVSTPLAAG